MSVRSPRVAQEFLGLDTSVCPASQVRPGTSCADDADKRFSEHANAATMTMALREGTREQNLAVARGTSTSTSTSYEHYQACIAARVLQVNMPLSSPAWQGVDRH